jgi:hypothetical protein
MPHDQISSPPLAWHGRSRRGTTAAAHAAVVEPEMHGTSTGPYVGAFLMDVGIESLS